MNKYVLVAIIFLYLAIATMLADSLILSTSGNILGGMDTPNTVGGISGVIDLLGTFWKIVAFQIDGMPSIATILFFYPPTMMMTYMLIDVLKDLIPFT
jgi:hypothetical protein